ncbi:MAG: hypothetical protein R3A52_12610 [Polyangiales bacterium]
MTRTARLSAFAVCCALWSGCYGTTHARRSSGSPGRSRATHATPTASTRACGDDCDEHEPRARRPHRSRRSSGGATASADERPSSPTEQ